MKRLLATALLLLRTSQAFAWNEKGHLVICRLAWRQLTDEQRAQVTAILKKHPHYEEYLTKGKPDGFSTDEWAFMKAGPWADWVRGGSARSYGHSTWHYINYPVTFPGRWRRSGQASAASGPGKSCLGHEPVPGQDQEGDRRGEGRLASFGG
ncbi:MAG TPA: S1/P1 nuclease [Gemmataceae bacterium]|jgi:hypothetical protein|nr:S1/P1 nuclease [Gemmataceae bacterium]